MTTLRLTKKLRTEYQNPPLLESKLPRDPLTLFKRWFHEAVVAKVREPHAMCLSTVRTNGQPSARMVLLKEVSSSGFVFATNYLSPKAEQIRSNRKAAIVFYWAALDRQVRIEGRIKRSSLRLSDAIFKARPRESQIAALLFPQSSHLPNRRVLEERFQEQIAKFRGTTIKRPSYWGAYELVPERIEFWQGQPNRVHDRILFVRSQQTKSWRRGRLAP